MNKISAETIEKYKEILSKDPKSKVFAALADGLRENGNIEQAESVARAGLEKNPQYIGGYVALGRILTEQKRHMEALPILKRAAEMSPDNLLAYQLLGQVFIELKKPEEALKAHKMALFLNPQSARSREVVKKLETLAATEYDDDLFQMTKLTPKVSGVNESLPEPQTDSDAQRKIDRQLSVIDALMIRGELEKAKPLIEEIFWLHPDSPEVRKRWELMKDDDSDEAQEIRPLLSREKQVLEKQIQTLQKVLRKLQEPPSI